MTQVKQESKHWGFYDRFGVTIGLIVDLAAIIAFLFNIRLRSGDADSSGTSDTTFGLMAVALLYSIGFVNYQIYKRWNVAKKEEDELHRRLVLALVTNFPFSILYIHTLFSSIEPTPFSGSLVVTVLFEILITPTILFMAYGFEILITGESRLGI